MSHNRRSTSFRRHHEAIHRLTVGAARGGTGSKALGLGLLACAFLIRPARAAEEEFQPLIGSPSFDHCVGDKEYWSLRDGVLTAGTGTALDHSKFLMSVERFGNFILKFQARSGGRALDVFGASDDPTARPTGWI